MKQSHLPQITIRTIPHQKQRYNSVDDFQKKKGKWLFTISKTKSDYEFLVLIHALVEAYLTHKRGIKWSEIDLFDIMFEKRRKKGNTDEPGDDPKAPYRKEHQFATMIEGMLAQELGVNWSKYEKTINDL